MEGLNGDKKPLKRYVEYHRKYLEQRVLCLSCEALGENWEARNVVSYGSNRHVFHESDSEGKVYHLVALGRDQAERPGRSDLACRSDFARSQNRKPHRFRSPTEVDRQLHEGQEGHQERGWPGRGAHQHHD